MKFKKVSLNHPIVGEVVIFSETDKSDFTYNYVLNLVPDLPTPNSLKRYSRLRLLPSRCQATDRSIAVEVSDFLLGGLDEDNSPL